MRRNARSWVDVDVDDHGRVVVDGSEVPLTPWTHAPRELPHAAFEVMRAWWSDALRAKHSHIVDAVLGKRMHVLEQCVPIEVRSDSEDVGVRDAFELGGWLAAMYARRAFAREVEVVLAALLEGPPASGKTSLINQVRPLLELS